MKRMAIIHFLDCFIFISKSDYRNEYYLYKAKE